MLSRFSKLYKMGDFYLSFKVGKHTRVSGGRRVGRVWRCASAPFLLLTAHARSPSRGLDGRAAPQLCPQCPAPGTPADPQAGGPGAACAWQLCSPPGLKQQGFMAQLPRMCLLTTHQETHMRALQSHFLFGFQNNFVLLLQSQPETKNAHKVSDGKKRE